ncbi:hypothetical protein VNI00_010166 [Paramarasmius palmivorus]|uniref:Uncharacterized protein n=1 Tax=Paramarasmius palmivorus TaxID=297713 RepID=A0AAW0CL77_9AGAR
MRARHMKRSALAGPGGQVPFVQNLPQVAVSALELNTTTQTTITVTPSSSSTLLSSSFTPASASTPTGSTSVSSASTTSNAPSATRAISFSPTSSSPTSSSSSATQTPSNSVSSVPPTTGTALNLISATVIDPDQSSSSSSPSASASSVPSTSNALRHTPSFYIGIVLGVMVVIAFVAALIAWWFRVRTRKDRRLKNLAVRVPWARSNSESSIANPFAPNASDPEKCETVLIREKSEKLRLHLELMGDRDVGEPKRTQSFIENACSPVKRRSLPILSLPSPPPPVYTGTELRDSVAYPLPSRPLPPQPQTQPTYYPQSNNPYAPHNYNYPQQPQYDYSQPEPGYRTHHQATHQPQHQFPTEFGTPRESVVQPRFLSLASGANRKRRMSDVIEEAEPAEGGADDHDSETWTGSVRRALGFPSQPSQQQETYTNLPYTVPARQRSRRRGMGAGWVELADEVSYPGQETRFDSETPASITGLGLTPSTIAPTTANSAAPLIIKKKHGLSPSRASSVASKYSVMTEKEEAAGRALRARWARVPGRV